MRQITLTNKQFDVLYDILEDVVDVIEGDLITTEDDNGTGDFDNADYVSEWDDFTDVEVQLLLNIYKCELVNKVNYANSLTTKEVKSQSKMNTYDEQFYKEIVKESEFSYGKFNENNYPLHLQQH